MTNEELTELRAALIQWQKATEQETECMKRILAIINKRLGLRPKEAPIQAASLAGAVHPVNVTTT